jgi:2-amino-4-hydroxy-6-hydroxymethyldihydropteridine diphosphokinase
MPRECAGAAPPSEDSDTEIVAYIGLGANLGDACGALRAALAELGSLPRSRLLGSSALYRSAPVDAGGPDFVNAVAELGTRLGAQELLEQLQAIEARHGRVRPYRHAPRTLDLDLLLYGNAVMRTPTLTVPHPRLHERAFVLRPLAEIAPKLRIPRHGSVTGLLAGVAHQRADRLQE